MGHGTYLRKIAIFTIILLPAAIVFQNCSQNTSFSSLPQRVSGSTSNEQTQSGPANLPEEVNEDENHLPVTDNNTESEEKAPENLVDGESDRSDKEDSSDEVPKGEIANEEKPDAKEDEAQEKPDELVSEETNRDEEVSFAKCEKFVEITENSEGIVELPTREKDTKICYFKQIMQEVPLHSSGSMDEVRSKEVLASNHNGNSSEYINPFVLGDVRVKFSNLPGWKIAISGAYNNPKQQIAIDNFYLVDFQYGQNPNRVQVASAFGTKDAEPGDGASPILYGGLALKYTHYADGGTAWVDAIELTPGEDVARAYLGIYDLRLQALDCGGSARGTDVFLVFH